MDTNDSKRKRNGRIFQSKVVELLRKGEHVDRYILGEATFNYEECKNNEQYTTGINENKNPVGSERYIRKLKDNFIFVEKRNFTTAINKVKDNISITFGITLCVGKSKIRSNVPCYWWPEDKDVSILDHYEQETKKDRTLRMKNAIDLLKDSYGIIPSSWLAKLIEEDLYSESNDTIIEFEQVELYGAEKLPELYFAIRDKHAISFMYQPWGSSEQHIVLHPHYLKEYNFRWYVFGHGVINGKENKVFHWSLDRIASKIKAEKKVKFIESTRDYSTYFDDIIGVTHINKSKVEEIKIFTKDIKVHKRILTRPIHKSQEEIEPFDKKKGYGLLSLEIRYNPELISNLLSFGTKIKVEGKKGSSIIKKLNEEYINISTIIDKS